jgi:hypothetical protein
MHRGVEQAISHEGDGTRLNFDRLGMGMHQTLLQIMDILADVNAEVKLRRFDTTATVGGGLATYLEVLNRLI